MIIWAGRGWCVPLITFAFLLASELLTEAVTSNDRYYQEHRWPMFIAFTLAGLLLWAVAERWNREPGRILVDQATGEQVNLKRADSLFFIPIWYWSFILCAIGVLSLLL